MRDPLCNFLIHSPRTSAALTVDDASCRSPHPSCKVLLCPRPTERPVATLVLRRVLAAHGTAPLCLPRDM